MFEALGVKEDVVKDALTELMERLENDERAKVYKREFGKTQHVEKPMKNIEEGWSMTVELELVTKSLDELLQLVIEYGPSAVEVLEPRKITIDIGQAQAMLNTVSFVMHQFASAGLGGMVFIRPETKG
jgi:hypothetical protein